MMNLTRYFTYSLMVASALSLCACSNDEAISAPQTSGPTNIIDQFELAKDSPAITNIPDFASIRDVKTKKKAFFDFMRPIVGAENAKVAVERQRLLAITEAIRNKQDISGEDSNWLQSLAESYRVEMKNIHDVTALTELNVRVDTVPFRLALSQSANESSWGTSRFAKQGLNFFGQWCFSKGCGIVPKRRNAGMSHEVAKFASVNASVGSYIQNLNRGNVYEDLRRIRAELRSKGKKPTAHELAAGLIKYSERGQDYVDEIRAMIRINTPLMGS